MNEEKLREILHYYFYDVMVTPISMTETVPSDEEVFEEMVKKILDLAPEQRTR